MSQEELYKLFSKLNLSGEDTWLEEKQQEGRALTT